MADPGDARQQAAEPEATRAKVADIRQWLPDTNRDEVEWLCDTVERLLGEDAERRPSSPAVVQREADLSAYLREICARAEALSAVGHGVRVGKRVGAGTVQWANHAQHLARDVVTLTDQVGLLLVRVQELTDERDAHIKREGEVNVERQRQEVRAELAEVRVQEAERAQKYAEEKLQKVASIMGVCDGGHYINDWIERRAVLGGDVQEQETGGEN